MTSISEIRQVAASSAGARALLLKSDSLVMGLAGALKPLCISTCLPATASANDNQSSAAAAVAVVWLLCLLLSASQHAAVLHVRGDAALLLRMYRSGVSRGLRHAALVALTQLHLAPGCSASDAASVVRMLVEATAACESAVQARATGALRATTASEAARASSRHSDADVSDAGDMGNQEAAAAAAAAAEEEEEEGGEAYAPIPRHDSTWQVASGLAALSNLFEGRSMPHPDGPTVSASARASRGWPLRAAAKEAFLASGGVALCTRLLAALQGAFPCAADSAAGGAAACDGLHTAANRQAEALWLVRATCRVLAALTRGEEALAERCGGLLGGVDGLCALLHSIGILSSGHAAPALEAWLEIAIGDRHGGGKRRGSCGMPLVAAAVLRILAAHRPSPPHYTLRLVETIRSLAVHSEESAVHLGRAGVLREAIRLLERASFPSDARVTSTRGRSSAQGSQQQEEVEEEEEGRQRRLRHALGALIVSIARCWGQPSDLRAMLDQCVVTDVEADAKNRTPPPPSSAPPRSTDNATTTDSNHHATSRLRLSPGPLSLLLAATRPMGPSMAYRWLRPGTKPLPIAPQERAWPPAQGYTIGCWVRRPELCAPPREAHYDEGRYDGGRGEEDEERAEEEEEAAAHTREVEEPLFTLYELETVDEKSFAAAHLRYAGRGVAELSVQTGSNKRVARCRLTFPLSRGSWHHLCVVHERRRPVSASRLTVYVDGAPVRQEALAYPAFDCCHTVNGLLGFPADSIGDAAAGGGGGGGGGGDAADGADDAYVGWHLGPSFGSELLFTEFQVREVCAMGWASPWLQLHVAESHTDELRNELQTCWLQSSIAVEARLTEAFTPPASSGIGLGASAPVEFRLPPSKMIFVVNALADGGAASAAVVAAAAAAETGQGGGMGAGGGGGGGGAGAIGGGGGGGGGDLVEPHRLVQCLPAVGGASALLRLVEAAHDGEALLLAIRACRHFLLGQPMNAHLFADVGYFGLRFCLRAKLPSLIDEGVCDALLSVCCKARAVPAAAARSDDERLLLAFSAAADACPRDGSRDVSARHRRTSVGGPDGAGGRAGGGSERRGGQNSFSEGGKELAVTSTGVRAAGASSSSVIANVRMLRILLLDRQLWGRASPGVQRHWLQRLHGLLTEDAAGAWNARCLADAGLLDCLMVLLSTRRLAASSPSSSSSSSSTLASEGSGSSEGGGSGSGSGSGSSSSSSSSNPLLAARLILRTWHSVHFSHEMTQRVFDFLASTCNRSYYDGASDLQLLCLRVSAPHLLPNIPLTPSP